MKNKQRAFLAIALAAGVTAQAQTGNPAERAWWRGASESSVSLVGSITPASTARIPQLGTDDRHFRVELSTLQSLADSSVVWGEASYENGRRLDVRWCETSDLALLYPYVLGDPRGGDMKREQYRLNGGYAMRRGRWSYGLTLGYRALSEYRDHDPRPNNTVADLWAAIGVSHRISRSHAVGLAVNAGKYKQTSELAYLNELGAQKEYHLTGLGTDFARFSGTSNNTFYTGHNVGVSVQLHDILAGLSASLSYDHNWKEKVLAELNKLPLNELTVNTVKAEAGWREESWSVKAHATLASRNGKDNLFGDATGGVYPQLGSRDQYKGKQTTVAVKGAWRCWQHNGWAACLDPTIAYKALRNSHRDTGNRLDSDDLDYGATLSLYHNAGRSEWRGHVGLTQRSNLSNTLTLQSTASDDLAEALRSINRYLADGETTVTAGISYTRRFKNHHALGFGLDWTHGRYLSGERDNRLEARATYTL